MARPPLKEKQAKFLNEEFGLHYSAGDAFFVAPEKREEMLMALLMIECDEAEKQYPIGERGKIAVSILDEQFSAEQ